MIIYCLCWHADYGLPMQTRYFQSKDAAVKVQQALIAAYATLGIKNTSPTITEIKVE